MRSQVRDLALDRTMSTGWQTTLAWAEGIEPNTGQTRDGAWMPPQRSRLLELGLRQPADRGDAVAPGSSSSGLALALYRIQLHGLTRSDPLDRNYAVADASRQVSGVEGVASWRSGDWTVVGQFNAMRLRWLQASSASAGALPVNTPARTAALRIERRLIDAAAGKVWLQWQGRSSLYADSANRRRIPGTGLIDLGLQGSLGPWQSTLVLRNVADRDHVASVSSVDEVYQGPTRQWRWTLTARW
jgi:hypothetical protein